MELQEGQAPDGHALAQAIEPRAPFGGSELDEEGGGGFRLSRILAALLRFKWLLIAAGSLGAVAAVLAYRSIEPEYRVEGNLWVNIESPKGGLGGPIAQSGLLEERAWIDLLRSYSVLDPVVTEERLFVTTRPRWRHLFRDFELENRFRPGRYDLEVAEDGRSWTLVTSEGVAQDSGVPGDSIGTELGFEWAPPAGALPPEATIDFRVVNPRDASRDLADRIVTNMNREGNFITLALRGEEPERITRILQALMEQHVSVAANLKKAKLDELTTILEEQLESVRQELEAAENRLESFRVQTITLPSEESTPIAPGLDQTQDPVFQDFFTRRIELEDVERDLDRLQAVLDSLPETGIRVESFELIPAVQTSSQLTNALRELTEARAERRALLLRYTEDYQPVQDLTRDIADLEQRTIPSLTRSLLAELRDQRADLARVVEERSTELMEIPPRSIEEAGLQRRVAIADRLYTDLRQRFETARLAAASSIPDLSILDEPRIPSVPASDQRVQFAVMAFLGFLGAGVVGAVLMDRSDPRFRYLSDLSDEMGLEILGAVPRLRFGRQENSQSVYEAFRDMRMRTEFAHGRARPIVLSITSPDTGEGKTFVAANLAISFARLGRATLLIDGDTRRGDMHDLFDVARKPGLTDLLEGGTQGPVIRQAAYKNLHVLTSGSRRAASPELLSSSRMQKLLGAVKPKYEVIIIDSPPMAAGSDAFVLGAHAGNLILVLRSGATHKELAKGKLDSFLRLPVRILGGVLNDVDENAAFGSYRSYTYYIDDYAPEEELEEVGPGDEDGGPSVEEGGGEDGEPPARKRHRSLPAPLNT